ncbi:MAG: Unknown protein [uncultured Sulfurovum sp.]|uniref:Cyclic nucleotide-binding domain-containing protein n=1 Tax=uncultured Sulfurovum sp. TaxID=269237 RepID=A0A6S6SMV6_9BACT|nr:MAG: Unknown protein [uncultured Sulfurovum sp.]
MRKQFLRLINIQEEESNKIFYFFIFSIFIQSGVTMGESLANSMFLIYIGIEQLSIVYMITPFLILFIYIPMYSFFTSRFGERKFFIFSITLLIIINIIMYLFIEKAQALIPKVYFNYIFYFLLLYTTVMVITLYTLVWNFIDSFFDIIDSKRVFSIFSAGTALGAILGGVIVSYVSNYFSASILLLCWSFSSFIALILLLKISKKFKNINVEEQENSLPLKEQLVTMLHNIKSSTYILLLLFIFFISVLLATILEYEYFEILSKNQSVESLALLFGQIYIAVNIFNLIVNIFLFNRLVIRFGVNNVLLIQPIAYLLIFSYLSVYVGVEAGILGFFVVQGLLVSIDYNNQNLLYNGINNKIKYEVRTFIENLGEPFAIAFAGLILFFFGSTLSISQVAYIGSAIALIYLILAIILKYSYPVAMIKNLKNNWLDLTRNEITILDTIPIHERKEVLKYQNKQNMIMVTRVIRSYNEPKAIEVLLNYLNTADKTAYAKAQTLLEELLDSKDPKVIYAVFKWLDKNTNELHILLKKELGSRGLIPSNHALENLYSNSTAEVASASVTVLNSQYPKDFFKALERVDMLLQSHEEEEIIEGLYILGKSKHTPYTFYVTEFLKSENEKIITQTLKTILQLSNHHMNNLILPILEIFESASKEQRILSIKILAKIKDTSSILLLLKRIETLTIYEKYEILEMIKGMGLQAIPALVTVLIEKQYTYTVRSIAGRSLGYLAFSQFKDLEKDLILSEIELSYKLLYFYHTLASEHKSFKSDELLLLSKYFQDKHQIVLEFILEILSIGGNLPSVELMKTSIRSLNQKVKANAIEIIEQSTEQAIFKMLLPLLDKRDINEVIYFYEKNYTIKEYKLNDILNYALNSDNEIEILLSIILMPKVHPQYLKAFRKKLLLTQNKKITSAIFAQINQEQSTDTIYKLIKISQYKSMNYFNTFVLYLILQNSEIKFYKNNQTNQSLLPKHAIILKGECSINQKLYSEGDFINLRHIFSNTKQTTQMVKHTKDIELLVLNKDSLINVIEIYPEIGIKFLR